MDPILILCMLLLGIVNMCSMGGECACKRSAEYLRVNLIKNDDGSERHWFHAADQAPVGPSPSLSVWLWQEALLVSLRVP